MDIGLLIFLTDEAIDAVQLGQAAEEHGFESIFLPEHTHIPTTRKTPFAGGGELPREYTRTLDPFVALGAMAAATEKLRLGTGICLVIQRDPITLAKEVASLDHLSGGRFLFGIGAGWNQDEIENHGTNFKLRWRIMRERVLAMKEIWTKDEAEYHGQHVNFDPIWSWPKPAQKPHPPVLMGGDGPKALEALIDYCDEWLPRPGRSGEPFADTIAKVQQRAKDAGRGPIPISVFGGRPEASAIEEYERLGARRVLLRIPPAGADEVLPLMKQYSELVRSFR